VTEPSLPIDSPSTRRRIWLLAGGTLALLAILIVGLTLAGIGPLAVRRVGVRGTISLPTETASSATCQGEGEWADVHEGTTVAVKSAQGDALATGQVEPGRRGPIGRGCLFTFEVAVPAGWGTYRMAVGAHEVQPDLAETDLRLEIGITAIAGDLVAVPH
jgi:hypothetical protein